jgi:hypothetical protein
MGTRKNMFKENYNVGMPEKVCREFAFKRETQWWRGFAFKNPNASHMNWKIIYMIGLD